MWAARILGFGTNRSAIVKAGLDLLVCAAARKMLSAAGGLGVARENGAPWLETLLAHTIRACQGDERAILETLGAKRIEWAATLKWYPELVNVLDAERAKRK